MLVLVALSGRVQDKLYAEQQQVCMSMHGYVSVRV